VTVSEGFLMVNRFEWRFVWGFLRLRPGLTGLLSGGGAGSLPWGLFYGDGGWVIARSKCVCGFRPGCGEWGRRKPKAAGGRDFLWVAGTGGEGRVLNREFRGPAGRGRERSRPGGTVGCAVAAGGGDLDFDFWRVITYEGGRVSRD